MRSLAILALCASTLLPAAASAQTGLGTVTISYELFHPHRIASNQLAVWIEDAGGALVRTVFATDFMTRRRGYLRRPQCCPEWVKLSDLPHLPDDAVDAMSGATQKPGHVELAWDCADANGAAVPPGVYTYKVEGNISWEKRVIWEGRIQVGGKPSASKAVPSYIPDSARTAGTLLTHVEATFRPSR